MEYRELGTTGIRVSRLCFGALTVGPLQANLPLAEGAAVIRYALEKGINFIDTAKLYGTYPYIRQALVGWDKPVVIASKSYDYTKEGMEKSLDDARKELGRDVLDIFMLHEQESELTLEGHRPALEYLMDAKARGLIKAVGVSTHTVAIVKAILNHPEIEIVHPIFNIKGIGIVDGTISEMEAAIKAAYMAGKGIYAMKALGGGNLIPLGEQALRYTFGAQYIHSVAIGSRMTDEIDYNLAILSGFEPPAELDKRLKAVSRHLFIEDWCEGCGTCVDRCPFGHLQVTKGRAELKTEECMLCGYCGASCPNFAIKVI